MTRAELAPLVGRTVTGEATYTAETRIRQPDGARLHLVRQVYLYPALTVDHFWLALSAQQVRRLGREERFAFRARVVPYQRLDGSADIGLVVTRVLA